MDQTHLVRVSHPQCGLPDNLTRISNGKPSETTVPIDSAAEAAPDTLRGTELSADEKKKKQKT